jgi:NhaP-type Na+/H+ or K+/H+ antiporter
MDFAIWSVIVGVLLVVMALSGSVVARLPISTAMLYLMVGIAVSPLGIGLLSAKASQHAALLEMLTEVVVLISLFSAGLKLSSTLTARRWMLPLRLAVGSMTVTVLAISLVGVMFMGLSVGAAILLGGILAPTDPVLASDVQVHTPGDRDQLRFSLTGEGGLNDGSAFPFVMLGLGLLGLHDIGPFGLRWLALDVLWGSACGLAVGAGLGLAIGKLVLFLRREHREATGLDDFLALGLVALSYGTALMLRGYGFLAVFAAGVALRHLVDRQSVSPAASQRAVEKAAVTPDATVAEAAAVHQDHAPAYMAHAILGFNEQLERIGEVTAVIAIGALLWAVDWHKAVWWFVPLLLLLIRPLSVAIGLAGSSATGNQRLLIGWFGIRGIGSLYYLMYATNHGLPATLANQLTSITLSVVVASILLHGISVTPLMAMYERTMTSRRRQRRGPAQPPG